MDDYIQFKNLCSTFKGDIHSMLMAFCTADGSFEDRFKSVTRAKCQLRKP